MISQLPEIWSSALELIKVEMTEVSFNTWILPVRATLIKNSVIYLSVPNEIALKIISQRYKNLIRNCIIKASDSNYDISIAVDSNPVAEEEVAEATPLFQDNEEIITNSSLNPKYTFETFVIGNSNRLAHAASTAVAESPARAYNPLFLYGGVGLGKTHLMHAIGHYILKQKKQAKIMYVTSETFTNELINSIQGNTNNNFRNKYRNVDVLLIDDIQFIANKERTQEEFFHTFNTLYGSNKQIVISSDRPPKEIPTLEDRLRTRFEQGLIADIQAPDLETRIAILKKKAKSEKINVSDDILLMIAKRIQTNIRELEGALIRLMAYSTLTNGVINEDLANQALKEILTGSKQKLITPSIIKEIISEYFDIRIEELNAKKRNKSIVYPRQIAMYLCRELTDLSLPKIGEAFGRDHTTIMHAHEKMNNEQQIDATLKKTIEELKEKINGYHN